MISRTNWSDARVERDLREYVTRYGHFPSVANLRKVGQNALMCAATKRGGLIAWAKRLGFERKFSSSDFGWQGEKEVAVILKTLGFSVSERPTVKCPYDLLVNSVVRCDVKTAKYAECGANRGWQFRIGKIPTCDVFILYQPDTRISYVIPWLQATRGSMTIVRDGGKYARYRENWGLINALSDSFHQLYFVNAPTFAVVR